ncbi:TVP38/TMEM64 family protein [Mycobacterium interjectum]|uniref:TVP38/TMEM64 family protein n=1 Tax=Mycobacterium interjectum TaxID=33895 RepID=UPI000833BCFC|nr:TVP38/TMEM64 family protein [Mycobacterium interjectum]MCV7092362.1 TVP38/TMEM64 family protein [Mycobacterium interjectum]
MTASATCKISARLRDLRAAIGAGARQLARPRAVATVVGITALIAVATWLRLPTPLQMRDWAESVGPWFPLAFLGTHVVATVVPVPRTAFTLAAGLLFGPLLGVAIAVVASTASAVLALLLVRAAGWQLNRLVRHRSIDTVDERLRERGWLAILSLRLIPAVPFSAINYAAGASTVRVAPYTFATIAGLLPGTAAVVILGDALAGHPSPLLFLVSLCTASVGVTGLVFEIRQHRRHHRRKTHSAPQGEEPAPKPAAVS